MWRRFLRNGGWLLLLPLFVVAAALQAALAARAVGARLAREGIEAEATITERHERRRFVPNVRNRLVEPERVLRFSYRSGSVLRGDFHVGTGEARVSREFFESHETGSSATLRYLPEDDRVFELEPGSHAREAGNALIIAGIIGVLGVALVPLILRRAGRAESRQQA